MMDYTSNTNNLGKRFIRFFTLAGIGMLLFAGYRYAPIVEFKPYCKIDDQQFSGKLSNEFQERFEYALQQLGGTETFEWGGWYRNSDDRYYFSYADVQSDVVLNAFNASVAGVADPNAFIGPKTKPTTDATLGEKLYWTFYEARENDNDAVTEKTWCDLVRHTTQVNGD